MYFGITVQHMKWGKLVVSSEFFVTKYGSKYGVVLNIGTIKMTLVLDTGSPISIISYKSLLRSFLPQDIKSIFDKLNMDNYTEECGFKSATGNNIISKPAILHDVQLSGHTISKMGIFLSNIEKPLALLGTDFIDACSINKECGSILFRTVNENLAFKNFELRIKECEIPNTGMPDIIDYVDVISKETVLNHSKTKTEKRG